MQPQERPSGDAEAGAPFLREEMEPAEEQVLHTAYNIHVIRDSRSA